MKEIHKPIDSPTKPQSLRQEERGDDQVELPYRDDDDDEIADLIDLATFDVSDVFDAVEGRMLIAEEQARASISEEYNLQVMTIPEHFEPSSVPLTNDGDQTPEPHEVFSKFTGKMIPETDHELEKAEEILAAEFAGMSVAERDKIVFEIHGMATETFDETPEKVEAALSELERHIQLIPTNRREAYEKARYINQEYVNDRAFRIMFLRSELFDSKKAAFKMIKHFTIKRKLFGDSEILCRDVRQSDLNEQEMKSLNSGFFQILPNRDAAGRAVVFVTPSQKVYSMPEDLMKTVWYMLSNCLRDEETQKKGIVVVVNAMGHSKDNLDVMRKIHWCREGLPKRVVGLHHCTSDDSLKPFLVSVRMYLLNKQLRSRLRPHQGDHVDIMFELQTFGIPVNEQLLHPNGSVSLAWHREWLEVRRSQEEAAVSEQASDKGVVVPRRFDVLFGRGKNTREHTGNLRCVLLVEMNQKKYEAANKYEKTEIAERIVTMIHESYGRFLRWDRKEGWVEVDRDAAREKISHFFRHLRSKQVDSPTSTSKPVDEQSITKRVTPSPSPIVSSENHDDERSAKQMRADRNQQ